VHHTAPHRTGALPARAWAAGPGRGPGLTARPALPPATGCCRSSRASTARW
jgi:hypothetical protein